MDGYDQQSQAPGRMGHLPTFEGDRELPEKPSTSSTRLRSSTRDFDFNGPSSHLARRKQSDREHSGLIVDLATGGIAMIAALITALVTLLGLIVVVVALIVHAVSRFPPGPLMKGK